MLIVILYQFSVPIIIMIIPPNKLSDGASRLPNILAFAWLDIAGATKLKNNGAFRDNARRVVIGIQIQVKVAQEILGVCVADASLPPFCPRHRAVVSARNRM